MKQRFSHNLFIEVCAAVIVGLLGLSVTHFSKLTNSLDEMNLKLAVVIAKVSDHDSDIKKNETKIEKIFDRIRLIQ